MLTEKIRPSELHLCHESSMVNGYLTTIVSKHSDNMETCYKTILQVVTMIIKSYKCKKTVVYHLANGSTVLLRIENSKNDRLKVILLVAVWLSVNMLHSNTPLAYHYLRQRRKLCF